MHSIYRSKMSNQPESDTALLSIYQVHIAITQIDLLRHSGSMSTVIPGTSVTSRAVASALALVTLRTEAKCECVAFCHKLIPLAIECELEFRKSDQIHR